MKIKAQYKYSIGFIPKRCRNTRYGFGVNEVAITIKEPTAEEFPVALITHDMKSVCEGMTSYEDYKDSNFRMFDEEYRVYKGKLYLPERITHGVAISTLFVPPEKYFKEHFSVDESEVFNAEDYPGAKIVGDCANDAKKTVRSEIKKYLVFDNKVWKPCNEPMYLVQTFGLGHNHGGTAFFIEDFYNLNIGKSNYFNALQREEAITYGKSIAARRGDTDSIDGFGDHDIIEVLIPEVIKRNPKKEHGDGCALINTLNAITEGADNASNAAVLALGVALAEIS